MPNLDRPIRFVPYLKTVIWGGDAIARYKRLATSTRSIGESWEISGVQGQESVVSGGPLGGRTITSLIRQYGAALVGTRVHERYGTQFPLLIKFIDARHSLSLQVHPDEALAMQRHNLPGKSEMWYIVGAKPDAELWLGLKGAMTPHEFCSRITDNTVMDMMTRYSTARGQFYYVPAGTLHAIGAGNLIVEVQQACDVTYRVYDYGRRDALGNLRELHLDQALDAIDFSGEGTHPINGTVIEGTAEAVVDCPYFTVDIIDVDASEQPVGHGPESFTILTVTEGSINLTSPIGGTTRVSSGHTVLIAACATDFKMSGKAKVLSIYCK